LTKRRISDRKGKGQKVYHRDCVRNQGILERKPAIKVTSKSIEFILELLANGWERNKF
jgi:hypothetical protein